MNPDDPRNPANRNTVNIGDEVQKALADYEELANLQAVMQRTGQRIDGSSAVLRIEIEGGGTPLFLPLFDQAVIGRRDPATQESPALDLTPYGAYQMGISRKHVVIELREHIPVVIDLGSRNGTYLNGARLPANQPIPLQDEDEIRLGKIIMRIWIEAGE